MSESGAALLAMGDDTYVRLTTFRKTGVPVHTAVCIALDGDRLLVTTGAESGKVKRIRHTPRIELTPCDRAGKIGIGAPVVVASAAADSSAPTRKRLDELLLEKYGLQYRVIRAAAKLRSSSTSTAIVITAG